MRTLGISPVAMARTRRSAVAPKRNSSQAKPHNLARGVLLTTCGGMALAGLVSLSQVVKLDTLLVASQAIFHVISGVKGIALGVGQLVLGLLQMLGFAALAVVAVIAVLAVISGSVQIGLKLLPQLEDLWNLLAHGLNRLTELVSLPHRPTRSAPPTSTRTIARASTAHPSGSLLQPSVPQAPRRVA